jgi:adenylate cyclase
MTAFATQRNKMVALNADVVGYSRLISDDSESTMAAMDNYRQLVDAAISESGGTLVDFVGDNFMAAFDAAKNAVQTAIAIASEIERANADKPKSRRVRFRMGMDLGDVIVSGGRYFGDALNIASRIQAMAPPGGLCVSGRVYRALDEPALRFRPIGRQRLKNISGDIFPLSMLKRGLTRVLTRFKKWSIAGKMILHQRGRSRRLNCLRRTTDCLPSVIRFRYVRMVSEAA